jgi:hypothetical protein
VSEQAVVANANSQPSEKRVQQNADTYGRPRGVPEHTNDPQMHGNEETYFDGLELVANGNRLRGRQRHADWRHKITSNACPGIRPKPAVFYWMYDCPVEFRHQERRARETNPLPFSETIRLASGMIIPVRGQACTKFDGIRRNENSDQPDR